MYAEQTKCEGWKMERKIRVNETNIEDNGGRRKNSDRRSFSYTVHIPERRRGLDRRKGDDRRLLDRNQA